MTRMTDTIFATPSVSSHPKQGQIARLVAVFDALIKWQDRARNRVFLAELSDRELRDVGLSRADIDAEVTKPFWQP